MNIKIFISYAREDIEIAKRLYNDLKQSGAEPWLDEIDLIPGQNWKHTITRAIRESRFFLTLLSSKSLSKKGYVQKELKTALDILEEFPVEDIFVIPVRIDNCKPVDDRLTILHQVDLFPSYQNGLNNIIRAILPGKNIIEEPAKEDSPPKNCEKSETLKQEENFCSMKANDVNSVVMGTVHKFIQIFRYDPKDSGVSRLLLHVMYFVIAFLITFSLLYIFKLYPNETTTYTQKIRTFIIALVSCLALYLALLKAFKDMRIIVFVLSFLLIVCAILPAAELLDKIIPFFTNDPPKSVPTTTTTAVSTSTLPLRADTKTSLVIPADSTIKTTVTVPTTAEFKNIVTTTVTVPYTTTTIITNSIGMKFVYIPSGEFMMGSPKSEFGRYPHETLHKVILTKAFYMQTTEVTQGQWKAIMGNNLSDFKDCGDDCPVESVSWDDAQAFISRLNKKEGKEIYRLPTEAEWEYACRAGTTTPFYFGQCLSTEQANYDGNYPLTGCPKVIYNSKTLPVRSFPPNSWGLYDMHGNVYEWCQDWYGEYPNESVFDPIGALKGSIRVVRGGSWGSRAQDCRSAYRNGDPPDDRDGGFGFRVQRSLP